MKKFSVLILTLTTQASQALPDDFYSPPKKYAVRTADSQSLELSLNTSVHPAFVGLSEEKIIQVKKQFRKSIPVIPFSANLLKKYQPYSALPSETDLLSYFLQMPAAEISRNLEVYEQQRLLSGSLNSTPWSDSYWPIYKGILGQRYADEEFEEYGSGNFRRYFDYVHQRGNRFPDIIEGITDAGESKLLNLSPSEKYDLLLGDGAGTLTQKMWDDGRRYEDSNGNVESWMGICHGWAIAAYIDQRPLHKITVLAQDQKTPVTFFPSDMKGLLSLLWANTRVPSYTVGSRCDERNPVPGPGGRLSHPECEDVHPGLWHLAVLNQIGIKKESFVMDSMWDFEVWNQPVLSYAVEYFNPSIGNVNITTSKFKEAMVASRAFRNDRYARFRAPQTKYIVGVKMNLDYLTEDLPNHNGSDGPEEDRTVRVTYYYDLELDENFEIIGGEWLLRQHPDFLWTAPRGTLAWTSGDTTTRENWDGNGPISEELRRAAFGSSSGQSANGLPLGKIVRRLVEMSRQ